MNKLKYEPVGFRVLVEVLTEEKITSGGIILPETEEMKRRDAGSEVGVIKAIGPTAWKAYDNGLLWAKVGDKIAFARYSGKEFVDNKTRYRIILDEDVICKIND